LGEHAGFGMRRLKTLGLRFAGLLTAALLTAAGPAIGAEGWLRAETERFIIYGEGDEALVRAYVEKLTSYDSALRAMNPAVKSRPETQKLEVYLVRTPAALQRVWPKARSDIAGFYTATPGGVFAIVQTRSGLKADEVLFHEYAHHFMLENFPAAYPAWFVEAWAEYYMTAEIRGDAVMIGGYNPNRLAWLQQASWIPLEKVVGGAPANTSTADGSLYYAEAWLLLRFLMATPERAVQLNAYLTAVSRGDDSARALQAATGKTMTRLRYDIAAMRQLERVQIRPKPDPQASAVRIESLSASAGALLLDRVRLATQPGDSAYLANLRVRAAAFPGGRVAELTLARAQFADGDGAAAEATVGRWLTANPDDLEALRTAADGELAMARRNPATAGPWVLLARGRYVRAFKIEPSDYRTLVGYVVSRLGEPAFPTDNDVDVLLTAQELAPAVPDIRLLAAYALLRKDRRRDAEQVLAPVLNSPHDPESAARAQALLTGKGLQALEAAAEGGR
jgi:Flp pilus assembly protein TadD